MKPVADRLYYQGVLSKTTKIQEVIETHFFYLEELQRISTIQCYYYFFITSVHFVPSLTLSSVSLFCFLLFRECGTTNFSIHNVTNYLFGSLHSCATEINMNGITFANTKEYSTSFLFIARIVDSSIIFSSSTILCNRRPSWFDWFFFDLAQCCEIGGHLDESFYI